MAQKRLKPIRIGYRHNLEVLTFILRDSGLRQWVALDIQVSSDRRRDGEQNGGIIRTGQNPLLLRFLGAGSRRNPVSKDKGC